MIYDCFTYFNEVDVLRLHLLTLKDVVDTFVVVEAGQTFTGRNKPFNFYAATQDWDEFESFNIVYIPIDFPDGVDGPWDREIYQRNQALLSQMDDEDIVIIGDVDEIVDPKFVEEFSTLNVGPHRVDVHQYFWNFNWQVPQHCNQGARPVIARRKDIQRPHDARADSELPFTHIAGWHFSFLGHHLGGFSEKVEAFAHTEVDLPEYKEQQLVLERAKMGLDPFDRFPLKYVELDKSTHPAPCFREEFQKHVMVRGSL